MNVDKRSPSELDSYLALSSEELERVSKCLSGNAYKLWTVMLNNKPDYVFHEDVMRKRTGLSHSSYQRALTELRKFGYVITTKGRSKTDTLPITSRFMTVLFHPCQTVKYWKTLIQSLFHRRPKTVL